MTRNAISVCVVVNPMAFGYKASLSEFSCSSLSRNLRNIPSKLRLDKAFYNVEILVQHNRRFKPRILASALPIEDEESKAYCLDYGLDTRRSNSVSEDLDSEEVSSISYSISELYTNPNHPVSVSELLEKLKAIQLHLLASEQWNSSQIKLCHRNYSASATNLVHYMAMKSFDIEQVKEELSFLSHLNWDISDSNVIASLEAGIRFLEHSSLNSLNVEESMMTKIEKKRNTELLFGPFENTKKTTHIMVTIGKEAIENETLVADLINNGTSIIRINCAHGDLSLWSEIIRRVRTSSQMLEKPCRVLMDLAGPKLRTGDTKPGPNVTKIAPKKDASGRVISPALIWLTHRESGCPPTHIRPDTTLFVDEPGFLSELEIGDTIRFDDARGKKRSIKISRKFHVFKGIGLVCECNRTCYIESGTQLKVVKGKKRKGKFPIGRVIDVPETEPYLTLRVGETLVISPKISGDNQITCSSRLLFDSVKPGEPISFDDGKIQGVIEGTSPSEIIVLITHAKNPDGTKLRPEKSINVPESDVKFQGLTSKDLMDLEFVASQADIVGASFLRDVNDVKMLRREVEKKKKKKKEKNHLGIVLKVETRSGFENLPMMLMEAMKSPNPVGVMVARGDLAVECGWENLADIQDEILRICSASNIPVIWATQVLESFVKSGVPTRAEITDVAYGISADCIMLNKGKHIVEAVSFLGTILNKNSTKMKPILTPRF